MRDGSELGSLRRLRTVGLVTLAVGGAGSVGLMVYAGHNAPRLLIFLFAIWVGSPFLLLLLANMVSKRWSVLTRATLYSLMVAVTLGSLVAYTYRVLWPPKSTPAFIFVLVPPLSWALILISILIAALVSRRLPR